MLYKCYDRPGAFIINNCQRFEEAIDGSHGSISRQPSVYHHDNSDANSVRPTSILKCIDSGNKKQKGSSKWCILMENTNAKLLDESIASMLKLITANVHWRMHYNLPYTFSDEQSFQWMWIVNNFIEWFCWYCSVPCISYNMPRNMFTQYSFHTNLGLFAAIENINFRTVMEDQYPIFILKNNL